MADSNKYWGECVNTVNPHSLQVEIWNSTAFGKAFGNAFGNVENFGKYSVTFI